MRKKARSKNPLNQKHISNGSLRILFQEWHPKSLTSETTFFNDLLIVDAYSKNQKLYSTERSTLEEGMDTLDMFQYRFGKIDEFGWRDLGRILEYAGTQFTSTKFQDKYKTLCVNMNLVAPEHQ